MSRSTFKIAGLELEAGVKGKHEGKQPSKWDDVRHHLVHQEGEAKGKPILDKVIEGFEKLGDASSCAARMRNTWGLPVKSYTNIKTGKFGICFKDADDEEEAAQATPAADDSACSAAESNSNPVAEQPPLPGTTEG